MNAEYLLTQLVQKGRALRRAQKNYYGYRADREDPIKKAHLAESKRREQDFDRALTEIDKVHKVPEEQA